MRKSVSAFCVLLFLAGPVAAVPDLHLLDLEGKKVIPFRRQQHCGHCAIKAVVFVFVSNDCPIANRYAPELQRLQKKYAPRNVDFWLVHADPGETPESIRQHRREYKYDFGVLRDPRHDLVKFAKVSITPEAALFLPHGELAYRGRIDNRYEDFGKQRSRATKRDLEDAIQAVLAGKPVRTSETKAVGCYIPGLQ